MFPSPSGRVRPRLLVSSLAAVAVATAVIIPVAASATGPVPLAVTPYGGFNSLLTRAPYVTDLTQTSAYVNWASSSNAPGSLQVAATVNGVCPTAATKWTPAAKPVPTSLPGPVNATAGSASSGMTGWAFSVVNGSGVTIKEHQASVLVTGLSPGTQYCYAAFSTDKAGAVDLLPATRPDQTFTTLDPVSTASTTPVTFDVIADTGENYANSSANAGTDVAFPGGVNPDEASLYHQIGQSGAKFLLVAGDTGYSGGTESNLGDLQQKGTVPEVSNVFGPSYFPQTGGIPTFAADGNHGQSVTTLRVWPTPTNATSSGGTYAMDSYSGVDGIKGSFPDNWYAFSTGNVRIYVIDGAWSDGTASGTGSATGAECAANPTYCKGYQADADEHWQTTSPEYKWLQKDLAAHPGGVKLAAFHYPLRSDSATQPSDPYLDNSSANPAASTSLEALLAANGVGIAFNGHAHTYQRIVPHQSGQLVNYVTGGGGGVPEPVLQGTTCQSLLTAESIYALGWTPSSSDPNAGTGSSCGTGATDPQSAAQVYNFLKVTVVGTKVTVTPTNAAGQTFDPQTYTFAPPPTNDFSVTATPGSSAVTAGSGTTSTISTTVTSGSTQSVALSATGAPTGATVSFNPPAITAGQSSTMTVTTSPTTPAGTSSITVTGTGTSATHTATFSLTVDPVTTSAPAFVQSASATEKAPSTSLSGSFPSATKPGDLLVLSASEYTGATNHLTSITDSAGNTWTRAGATFVSGHNSDGEFWYAANANPTTTVTAHVASAASMAFDVQEFSGVAPTGALDTVTGTSNTGTSAASGATTVSVANELVVGLIAGHNNAEPITVTSPGYSDQAQQTTTGAIATIVTGYQVDGAPGPQSFAGTFGTAMYWAAGVAVFKP